MDDSQDVQSVEQTTAPSSGIEQSTVDTSYSPAEEQSNTEEVETEEPGGSSLEENRIPYDRFQEKVQELNQMKEQMAALQAKAEIADKLGQAFNPQANNPDMVRKQQQSEAVRRELEQLGYVDKNTVDSLVEEKLSNYKWQERFVQQMDKLTEKYNGKDGGPRFKSDEVAEYMDQQTAKGNLITDPEIAFKLMNLDGIAESKAKAQKSSTFTEKPGKAHVETDQRKADLAAAAKTNSMSEFLKKYGNIPE